ncbi:MAG: inositol monophosphatase [Ruminococcaceae bacterium]|nr:inositol monophosphatase [Oscillospiraceae bacterium]
MLFAKKQMKSEAINMKLLEDMKKVALECGNIMLSASSDELSVETKTGCRDLVTKYDVAVQNYAVSALHEMYPDAKFFCEEGTDKDELKEGLVFVIDPIDGTANFAWDMHHSCVSIGCFKDGVPYAGAVYAPYTDEMFTGAVGHGAYFNDKPMHVTDLPLRDTIVLFGTAPYNAELWDETFRKAKDILPKCMDLRRYGAAALDLCYLAAGRAGLFFEEILALWDFAAGLVILNEAGGVAMRLDGSPLPLTGEKTNIIAGTEKTIAESGFMNGTL